MENKSKRKITMRKENKNTKSTSFVLDTNVVKLKLPTTIRIYPAVNISRVVRYRKPVKEQKMKESELVEVDRKEEWKVEKILNK